MFKSINVEAENLELILENSHGDTVIIPANKRNWVKQKLSEGCHDCIDSLVETLPIASQYAGDGSVYPPNKKVKVSQDNQIKEYDISSPEYKTLYNSGKLMSYDKNTDTYIATPLKEVTITAEAPQWLKDKRKYESQYSRDWYIDNIMPKFSRGMGISANNMHPNNIKEYDSYINDKVVEDIFKRKPTFDNDYSNDRLKTLQRFSQKELELIKNSSYASKIEPSIWSKFEQGLLSVGNMGSPVEFKNPSLSQEEAKKENNPLNILQPLSIPSKMVQSTYKKDYSFKDALSGKQNNANIGEDIVTDPLNLVGLGIWSKLSKANKFSKLEDAYQAIKTLDKTTLEKQIGTTLSNDDWQYLYRVQEKGFDIEKPTLKAIEERVASGKGKWYDNNILNDPELRANIESRDRYYGQWFEKDPKRLDYYLADKEDIEILRTKVPKEILEQYRVDKFDPEIAKKWSLSHETEYILPKDLIQRAEKFERKDWQKLIDEHETVKGLSKERQIAGSIEDVTSKVDELAKGPIRQAGLIDFKGALQRYPKGEVTPTEVEAYAKFHQADAEYLYNSSIEDTNPVTKMLKDDMINSYKKFMEAKYAQKEGKSTLRAEIAENQYKRSEERYKTHLQKNSEYYYDRVSEAFAKMYNREDVNYTLYGGNNWNKTDYALTAIGAAALGGATAVTGLAISPPAVKRKALKSLGVSTPVPGALSSKDTIIDLTNKAMDYAKVNEVKSGTMILGGEFIESANNTVRTAKDWAKSMAADADTYSDKNYPTKNIKSFYGVEDGKLKVGKVEEFKEDTELVPRRFGEAQISKAVMNGKEMRILDVNDKPIYQNTPNTGKFILYSPTTKKSVFVYITEGKKGVAAINKFIAENGDAQYIHMDNGRYEYYGINEDGLSDQDFKTYYEQDLGRSGTPGYNLIIK